MTCLLKKSLNTQEKIKELEIIYQNESISVFLDIAKFANFEWKNADGVCHVIHIVFGSSLGKV